MNHEKFRKFDEALLKATRKLRSREVPPVLLKGFSVSVAEKIRERENEKLSRRPAPVFGLRVLVPVFAVFLLFCTAVFRAAMPGALPFSGTNVSELADEITALKAVGAWNDEDDKQIATDETSRQEAESA